MPKNRPDHGKNGPLSISPETVQGAGTPSNQPDSFAEAARQTQAVIHEIQRLMEERRRQSRAKSAAVLSLPAAEQSEQKATSSPELGRSETSAEDLEQELQQYFKRSPEGHGTSGGSGLNGNGQSADANGTATQAAQIGDTVVESIRDRVVDALADAILEKWEQSKGGELSALQREVTDRITQRLLERMSGSR